MTDSERIKKMQNYTKASQVPEQGYCVVESVYDEQEYELIRTIFKELCHIKRGFSNEQSTIGFHPLLEWAPEMAPFYAKPILVDLRAKVLNDEVRLANSGAAVFNNNLVSPILSGWHNHYSWTVPETGLQCRNPERILCNIYVDGTMPDVGPLIVLPRNLNDSIYNQGETNDKWTGQETVSISAGSAVIFDRRSSIAPDVEIPTGYAICGVDIIKVGTIQLHAQKII